MRNFSFTVGVSLALAGWLGWSQGPGLAKALNGRALSTSEQVSTQDDVVRFNRDVRPILSDRCFLCHGPDQSSELAQETDLRLDDRESALEHGSFDFDDVNDSEILLRIMTDDPGEQMPPPDSHKNPLSESEIEIIRKWIEQGANFEKHWAYVTPERPSPSQLNRPEWVKNRVDAFVLKRIESENLNPSPPAERAALIRRVSFDLIGLPPTMAELDAFLDDPDADDVAFEKVVDRLLASPHYGEQMARRWLDAARYADTGGYQYDRERTQWVWRDWVINAFSSNMPFDQFTIEQLAGDLLPNATDQTRLATGFNRNHPITIEGGVVDEEYRTEYVIDRVVTTSTVWMGQTFVCARCHDHKYDPISQKEFYEFFAFFNNVPEKGLNGFDPRQKIASPLVTSRIENLHQNLASMQAKLDGLKLPFEQWELQLRSEQPTWTALTPDSVVSTGGATTEILADESVRMSGFNPETDDYEVQFGPRQQPVVSIRLEAIQQDSFPNGAASRGPNGNFVLTELVVESSPAGNGDQFEPVGIVRASADYEQSGYPIALAVDGKIARRGWAVDGNLRPESRSAVFVLERPIDPGETIRIRLLHRFGGSHQIARFRLSFSPKPDVPESLRKLLMIESGKRTAQQKSEWNRLLISNYGKANERRLLTEYNAAKTQLDAALAFPQTMIMKEMAQPRQAFVLERGEYDQPRIDSPVGPNVPSAVGSMDGKFPKNRLGLAQWLVSPEQPLTARVTINRLWQELFGVGLVKTTEDFGSQGEYPSHPELLDWLSVEFVESGWNVKGILKTMVMSNTYRQSSRLLPGAFARDPENRLLSRGPRFRLDAEAIRDNALSVSGLLDRKIGGASVYPYHPDGLWLEINNRPNYSRSYPHQTDPNQLYRRSMYTFWKRTVTPPSAAMFDAPSREYCIVRRSRTNTPLQAFVMLHDPQFVEAARHLAARMILEGGETSRSRIEFGFRLCTSRWPNDDELKILTAGFDDWKKKYDSDPDRAEQLLSVGVSPVDPAIDVLELATLTQIARMLINLSEFITKG